MKYILKIQFLITALLLTATLYANDTLIMGQLLQRIEQLQAKESSVFPKGSFPSYRLHALNKDREKADVNGFYTGLVAFTLNDIKPQLTHSQPALGCCATGHETP